jgi:anti-sigma-K factor RskA
MSLAEDNGPERGGDDLLAAEYVLGVLPQVERQAATGRIEAEPAFARAVEAWEGWLAPLGDAYQEVEPPASVKAAIDRRLFSAPAPRSAIRGGMWSSLVFWRGLAVAALAALLIAIAVPYLAAPPSVPEPRLVASLAADGSDVRYLAVYDADTGEVGLSHVSGERAPDRDFELWVIQGADQPVSLGVIPVGGTVKLPVSQQNRARLASGSTLAVSLEPRGGSPSNLPTGPVVAAGGFHSIF